MAGAASPRSIARIGRLCCTGTTKRNASAPGLRLRRSDCGHAPAFVLIRGAAAIGDEVHLLVVATSDRGLCGAFNSNTVRRALRFIIDNGDFERYWRYFTELDHLRTHEEASVGELTETLGTSQQNVSKHLKLLVDRLHARREGHRGGPAQDGIRLAQGILQRPAAGRRRSSRPSTSRRRSIRTRPRRTTTSATCSAFGKRSKRRAIKSR